MSLCFFIIAPFTGPYLASLYTIYYQLKITNLRASPLKGYARALTFVQNSSMYHEKGDYIHHALDEPVIHLEHRLQVRHQHQDQDQDIWLLRLQGRL